MFKKLLTSLFLLVIAVPGALAQTGGIEGQVTDAENGDPLPGVSIVVEGEGVGAAVGAATGPDGFYEISDVPAGEQVLRATFVGYSDESATIEVVANEVTELNFQMGSDPLGMEEVVVSGAGGEVETRKLGNTVSSINTADLENAPIGSFSDLVQGREPGMLAMPGSGMTGEGSQIRIRGSGSISQVNEPVIYLNGMRVNNGGGFGGDVSAGGIGAPSRLDDIDPNSIERVEVLKGAAAATLYGTQASNGVIQIFTKQGQQGDTQYDFEVKQGFIQARDVFPEMAGYSRTQAGADTLSRYFSGDVEPFEIVSKDFTEELHEIGQTTTFSGSASGGSELINFYISGRYQTENGPLSAESFDFPTGTGIRADDAMRRAQVTSDLTIFPTETFQVRLSSYYTNSHMEAWQTGNNISAPYSRAIYGVPEFVRSNNPTGAVIGVAPQEGVQQETVQDVNHYYTGLNMSWTPMEMLSLDSKFGVDFTSNESEFFRPFGWDVVGYVGYDQGGERSTTDENNLELTVDTKASLDNSLSESFSSSLTVGVQGFLSRNSLQTVTASEFPGPGFEVTGSASSISSTERFREVVNGGVFAQEQVGYNDYIFTTIGARYDASSAFGDDFNAVLYPKVSVSTVFSDAPFWEPFAAISSLRIRAAYGESGLQPGAFDALTTFSSINSPTGAGIQPENLGNPALEPERSAEWEAGLDVGFFKERLGFEATYWDRTTTEALVPRQFVPSGGFENSQLENIGELKARGVELSVDGDVFEGENISVNLFANGSYLWEQVESLGGAPPLKVGGSYPRYRNFVQEGYAPGAHLGAKVQETESGRLPYDTNGDGRPDTREELESALQGINPQNADIRSFAEDNLLLADEDGDGDVYDHYKGKPAPDWQGSFGTDISFLDGFNLSTLFEYKAGDYYVNDMIFAFRSSGGYTNYRDSREIERRFVAGGVDSDLQPQNNSEERVDALESYADEMVTLAPFSGVNAIQSADFIRWRELSLSYTLPDGLTNSLRMRNATISFTARNLGMITKFPGADPEINSAGRGSEDNNINQNFLRGVSFTGMPLPRRYNLSVRFGF